MLIGLLMSEVFDIASITLKGISALYGYVFSIEQEEMQTNKKLIKQVQDLEKMCSDISQQRLNDLKMYNEQIESLKEEILRHADQKHEK